MKKIIYLMFAALLSVSISQAHTIQSAAKPVQTQKTPATKTDDGKEGKGKKHHKHHHKGKKASKDKAEKPKAE